MGRVGTRAKTAWRIEPLLLPLPPPPPITLLAHFSYFGERIGLFARIGRRSFVGNTPVSASVERAAWHHDSGVLLGRRIWTLVVIRGAQ